MSWWNRTGLMEIKLWDFMVCSHVLKLLSVAWHVSVLAILCAIRAIFVDLKICLGMVIIMTQEWSISLWPFRKARGTWFFSQRPICLREAVFSLEDWNKCAAHTVLVNNLIFYELIIINVVALTLVCVAPSFRNHSVKNVLTLTAWMRVAALMRESRRGRSSLVASPIVKVTVESFSWTHRVWYLKLLCYGSLWLQRYFIMLEFMMKFGVIVLYDFRKIGIADDFFFLLSNWNSRCLLPDANVMVLMWT